MAYSAMQVANALIAQAKQGAIPALTPMKLQKLMFFAQSWYLKTYGVRLINDEFVRWKHGPVIQSVYYEFAAFGGAEIDDYAKDSKGAEAPPALGGDDDVFLKRLIATYGAYSGWQLSEMTHDKKGAWAMQGLGCVITDDEMVRGRV